MMTLSSFSLLTLQLLQARMTFFIMWNTKGETLWNEWTTMNGLKMSSPEKVVHMTSYISSPQKSYKVLCEERADI